MDFFSSLFQLSLKMMLTNTGTHFTRLIRISFSRIVTGCWGNFLKFFQLIKTLKRKWKNHPGIKSEATSQECREQKPIVERAVSRQTHWAKEGLTFPTWTRKNTTQGLERQSTFLVAMPLSEYWRYCVQGTRQEVMGYESVQPTLFYE